MRTKHLGLNEEHAICTSRIQHVEQASHIVVNSMTGFVIYQLANRLVASGIGCGYYDETGQGDAGGIARAMNSYFFQVCFAPDQCAIGFEYFVDHLLGSFQSSHQEDGGFQYRPSISSFGHVFDLQMLRNYWETYGTAIATLFNGQDKTIHTVNYTATYKEDLPYLFSELDKLLSAEEASSDQNP